MKRIIFLLGVSLSVLPINANADVYVKVDINGVAIDGPIMCDSGTCGANSEYSRLTLKPGESYVLQGTGYAGIGANNPNTEVKVDLQTNVWTVTNTQSNNVIQFTPQTSPGNPAPYVPSVPPTIDTTTIITDTLTVVVDTKTVAVMVDTKTATVKVVKNKKKAKK